MRIGIRVLAGGYAGGISRSISPEVIMKGGIIPVFDGLVEIEGSVICPDILPVIG